ncbi:MAG: hypothetical protein R2828_29600 [Saprospiraceae bacterium]
MQDRYRNFYSYSLFILLLAMILQSCKSEQECACPIERPTTSKSGSSLDSTNQSFSIDGGLEVNVPNIKKLIEAKGNLSGKIQNSDIQVEKTYWEVLGGDPQVIQNANLFWTIACAMYEITCDDQTITDEKREAEKRQIVREYDAKIGKIIEGALSGPDTPDNSTQTKSDKDNLVVNPTIITPTPGEVDRTESSNVKEISGSVYGNDDKALSGVEVWCASCADRQTATTDQNGYFSFKGTLKEKSINQQVQICFRYLGNTDCAWLNYNYLDQISITPKFE